MNHYQRILITGGSGFVGTNLVDFYLEQGLEVCNLDIAPPRNPEHRKYWIEVDLRERDLLIDEIRKYRPDVILHCAARTDLNERRNLDGYSANIDGICHLIDAIRAVAGIKRAIFFSSQLVCSLGYQPLNDDDYRPSTLYGRSKVIGEKIIKAASEVGAIWTIVRPTSLWGPWFDIPYRTFFSIINRGLYIHPDGVRTLKQWGFVGNTVFQIQRLLEAPEQSVHKKTFYLADYDPVELSVVADKVQVALGAREIRSVPVVLLRSMAAIGDALQVLGWQKAPLTRFRLNNILTDEVQDLEPLRQVVGPLPFSLDDGVRATAEWMKERGVL